MRELGLKVETLEELLYVSSSLRARVSVDQIGQDGELGIFKDSLTVDLRVIEMSGSTF